MMKKLAIVSIAATVMAVSVSLPNAHAQQPTAFNPQGVLKPEPFADVPPDHWAYNAVEALRTAGLTEGYPDRTFKGKRPMTRYEFARFVQLLLQSLQPRFAALESKKEVAPVTGGGVTQADLDALKNQMLTKEQVQDMINQAMAGIKPFSAENLVTKDQLATIQKLVDEFKDELARMGTDVDAVKKQLADVTGRVEAIEAELARMPKIHGDAEIIFKGGAKSSQTAQPGTPPFRPALDADARPLPDTTNVLSPVLPYYDLDLSITAQPAADVKVGTVLNVGNYLSSYAAPTFHRYTSAGTNVVTPLEVWASVPFKLIGSDEITLGRQTTQLTPLTFKAVDPDTYTVVPREDSGNVYFWGANTSWKLGTGKLRAFAGTDARDGRDQPLNWYPEFVLDTVANGLQSTFGNVNGFNRFQTIGGVNVFSAPIVEIGNFAGARLTFGEPTPAQMVGGTREVAVEATPAGTTQETTAPANAPAAEVVSGYNYGPLRNASLGVSWLLAARNPAAPTIVGESIPLGVAQDARAQVFGADTHFSIAGIKLGGEVGFAESQTGLAARPRAVNDTAIDVSGMYTIGLGGIGDLGIGAGWRRIPLGYLTPGYWGKLGAWKNPRGIQGWIAQAQLPLKWDVASFLSNLKLTGSAEFYEEPENFVTATGATGIVTPDPSERNFKINHYEAGIEFRLTNRNPVLLGFEQVFRDYVPTAGTEFVPLALPTGGVGGIPIVGTRIKNTETYLNFGIGHNFTPDVNIALLYQLVDFAKFAVDNSNQPANYRGYVATAQVGVRF